jgi:hypothetical protein
MIEGIPARVKMDDGTVVDMRLLFVSDIRTGRLTTEAIKEFSTPITNICYDQTEYERYIQNLTYGTFKDLDGNIRKCKIVSLNARHIGDAGFLFIGENNRLYVYNIKHLDVVQYKSDLRKNRISNFVNYA